MEMNSWPTICRTFPPSSRRGTRSRSSARRASASSDIRLLIGRRPGDIRRQPVGGFAGPVGPDAPVGTYGGGVVRRRQGTGTFAGDADRQRQGSFADADRVVIVRSEGGRERARSRVCAAPGGSCAGPRSTPTPWIALWSELHRGRAVVLAELAGQAETRLEQLGRAA